MNIDAAMAGERLQKKQPTAKAPSAKKVTKDTKKRGKKDTSKK